MKRPASISWHAEADAARERVCDAAFAAVRISQDYAPGSSYPTRGCRGKVGVIGPPMTGQCNASRRTPMLPVRWSWVKAAQRPPLALLRTQVTQPAQG